MSNKWKNIFSALAACIVAYLFEVLENDSWCIISDSPRDSARTIGTIIFISVAFFGIVRFFIAMFDCD